MADAFRKSALAQNLRYCASRVNVSEPFFSPQTAHAHHRCRLPFSRRRSGPAESKFTPSSYDDARADQDAESESASAATQHSKPIVTLTHTVTRFDADSQQDVTVRRTLLPEML
jgi:hypothetical protein